MGKTYKDGRDFDDFKRIKKPKKRGRDKRQSEEESEKDWRRKQHEWKHVRRDDEVRPL